MTLLHCIGKPYFYIFYVITKFFVDEWRAVLVMSVFQSILILGLVCVVALVTGRTPLLIPKLTLAIGTLVVRDNSIRIISPGATVSGRIRPIFKIQIQNGIGSCVGWFRAGNLCRNFRDQSGDLLKVEGVDRT
jgi:hypothetical protein